MQTQDETYRGQGMGLDYVRREEGTLGAVRERSAHGGAERLALGLGWFSIGLGATEILAPDLLAKFIGLCPNARSRRVMRAFGVREIAAGVGILATRRPAFWLLSRVAGDLVDLAALGRSMGHKRSDQGRLLGVTASVAAVTLVDAITAVKLRRVQKDDALGTAPGRVLHVKQAITVNRPVDEVYAFWRNLENLPRFMAHLESVEVLGGGRSRWRASGPARTRVSWEAETVVDRPSEEIAWRSVKGARVPNEGVVRFRPAPGGRGTEVHVELRYAPPLGALGASVAKLFGEEPEQQIKGDLRRFKQVMETGEVVHSDASVHRGMHPARPSNAGESRKGA